MEVEFEEYKQTPAQQPRGYYKPKKAVAPVANEEHVPTIKRETWEARVKRDLSQLMEDQIPEGLITHAAPALHRGKIVRRCWPVNACVARPFTKKEVLMTPEALDAQYKEWDRLLSKDVFDMDNVQDWSTVAAKARRRGKTVHFGIVFGFCVKKNAELVDAKPIYKFRYVFQGNRVTDQNYTTAMLQDLGSSPATMEASKAAGFTGCAPRNTIAQADAEQEPGASSEARV